MADIIKVPLKIGGSGDHEATEIRQILHGTVAIDILSVTTGAIVSASAAVSGMTSSFNVLVIPQAWVTAESVIVAAAAGISNGVQITASNPSAGTINPTSQTFAYWAWR